MKKNFKKTLIGTLAVLAMAAAIPSSTLCSNNFASAESFPKIPTLEQAMVNGQLQSPTISNHIFEKGKIINHSDIITYEILDNHVMHIYGTGDSDFKTSSCCYGELPEKYHVKKIVFHGIKTIDDTFLTCQNIEEIRFVDCESVTILNHAFYHCRKLKTISCDSNLKRLQINRCALANCPKDIVLPYSIKELYMSTAFKKLE